MILCYSILLCVLFLLSSCNGEMDCSKEGSDMTTMMRLKRDLLCGYDKTLRPVKHHTNRTTVGLIIAPRIINFHDDFSTLHIKTWLSMTWKDAHLSWNKINYDDIEQFTLDSSMVWVPDLSVYNTNDESDVSLDQQLAPVMIDQRGEVYAFMSPILSGHCVPNWDNWPHDVHECTLTLGSKRYLGSTVDFHFLSNNQGLWLKYLLPVNEWELIKISTNRNETQIGSKNETNSPFLVSLNYIFTLRRHASVYIATFVIPGVVIMLISLGALWIPSDRVERVAILCTVLFVEVITLHFLTDKIPANGDTTPYIVCFYRDSLLLTGLLIIETIVTRSLTHCTSNPSYLRTTFTFAASNKVLQYLFLNDVDPKNAAMMMESGNDEGSTLVSGDENVRQWQLFVNIVNRLCFILLVPVYFLLSVSLLPFNYSFSPN